jgi:hypothetical protein
MIEEADGSAVALVVRLADEMECFRDEHMFEKRPVNFYKRAQILVAGMCRPFPQNFCVAVGIMLVTHRRIY